MAVSKQNDKKNKMNKWINYCYHQKMLFPFIDTKKKGIKKVWKNFSQSKHCKLTRMLLSLKHVHLAVFFLNINYTHFYRLFYVSCWTKSIAYFSRTTQCACFSAHLHDFLFKFNAALKWFNKKTKQHVSIHQCFASDSVVSFCEMILYIYWSLGQCTVLFGMHLQPLDQMWLTKPPKIMCF